MERYTAMYPRRQPGLPDDLVTAYVDALRETHTAPGSATAQRTPRAPARDFTRECFVCVALDSSRSNDAEPAPRHHATDAQRRARLNELVEAMRQLDEELANLHRELGEDRPRNPRPNPQQVLV
jgi:hypothetical protein